MSLKTSLFYRTDFTKEETDAQRRGDLPEFVIKYLMVSLA